MGQSRLRFTLPGEWWPAPMEADAAERTAAIAAFVRTHYGRRDDLARARAEHRGRLTQALDAAIDQGATQYHVSLANDGGVAFASTLSEYVLPGAFGTDPAPALLADRVVVALHSESDADAAWRAFAAGGGLAFAKGESIVLRRIVRREADPVDESSVESLTADYWLTVPGAAEVVLVTLSTVLLALEPLMLELFDRIIDAAEWVEAAPPRQSLRAELTGAVDPS
jgi:hypothetical protein